MRNVLNCSAFHGCECSTTRPFDLTGARSFSLKGTRHFGLTSIQSFGLTSTRSFGLTSTRPFGLTGARPLRPRLLDIRPFNIYCSAFHGLKYSNIRPFGLTGIRSFGLHVFGPSASTARSFMASDDKILRTNHLADVSLSFKETWGPSPGTPSSTPSGSVVPAAQHTWVQKIERDGRSRRLELLGAKNRVGLSFLPPSNPRYEKPSETVVLVAWNSHVRKTERVGLSRYLATLGAKKRARRSFSSLGTSRCEKPSESVVLAAQDTWVRGNRARRSFSSPRALGWGVDALATLAYFAVLCGAFAWGVDSSSLASKRRPKVLETEQWVETVERGGSCTCFVVLHRFGGEICDVRERFLEVLLHELRIHHQRFPSLAHASRLQEVVNLNPSQDDHQIIRP
ncbi:hypothetical protein LR48_Vigan11g157400 [Vigna angularis]|uniref:Uncharacterized protein n=1 Tax=Phaseolus angularis TaxID=3914 RepID=A0A0L9VTZ4_PHAAN|nr:hypothetical protein LR48_Vigan11g157400 [Vigna angularis]